MEPTAPRPWWPLGDLEQMREALRYWISNNWDTSITVGEWWERLASAGLAVPTWNRSHGGLAATSLVQQIVEEELAAAGAIAPPLAGEGVRLLGPALRQFATQEQSDLVLPAVLTGQQLWTVMLTEPGSDDPMATTTTAEFDWKYLSITGTKTCTEDAATHALVLVRSTDLPGRKGLTTVLVDLTDQGITCEPGLVHFEAARMTHEHVLGNRDAGWAVVKTILPYMERSLAGRIRRGMVNVEPGEAAGNLQRTVADVLSDHQPPPSPPVDRRAR